MSSSQYLGFAILCWTLFFLLAIFYLVPIAAVQALVQVDKLERFKFFRVIMDVCAQCCNLPCISPLSSAVMYTDQSAGLLQQVQSLVAIGVCHRACTTGISITGPSVHNKQAKLGCWLNISLLIAWSITVCAQSQFIKPLLMVYFSLTTSIVLIAAVCQILEHVRTTVIRSQHTLYVLFACALFHVP